MKICFLARPCFDKFSVAIYHDLVSRYDENVEGYFITSNKKESNFIKLSIKNPNIYETSKFIRENWDKLNIELLEKFESKYDCAPIWQYIYTDRFLINRDYDYVVKIAAGLFLFFEDVFEKNNIDIYYSECIATLQCYVAYLVGKKYGVRFLSQMTARGMDATHHYFLDDPFQGNMNFDRDYVSKEYSIEEYDFANHFLTDFESRDIKPELMSLVNQLPKIKLSWLKLIAARIYKRFDPLLNDCCSYMYYEEYKEILNPIKFYYRYNKSKKYYRKPDYRKKYVYFPLHYQPEASTIVCAPKYEKQLFFIDSWAKSLPADTVLYVKEHYALIGQRDLNFYIELKKYPNVFLIDPLVNSREMIDHSVAVTTLTGTAGWEAMLLRKPVFIGGTMFYDTAPGVVKIDDMFGNYLVNINKWKKPDRDLLLKYLCEYFRTIHVGNVYPDSEIYLSEHNISNLVDALWEQLVKLNIVERKVKG